MDGRAASTFDLQNLNISSFGPCLQFIHRHQLHRKRPQTRMQNILIIILLAASLWRVLTDVIFAHGCQREEEELSVQTPARQKTQNSHLIASK